MYTFEQAVLRRVSMLTVTIMASSAHVELDKRTFTLDIADAILIIAITRAVVPCFYDGCSHTFRNFFEASLMVNRQGCEDSMSKHSVTRNVGYTAQGVCSGADPS